MINTCWTGCSFTWGEGFTPRDRDIHVYDRIVCRHMGWMHNNCSKPGASNHLIFLSAAQNLMSGQFDKLFVQWSALNRMWFFPGPDAHFFINDEKYPEFVYRDLRINQKDKKKLQNLVLLLNHDYHNILQLIDYCCILNTMSKEIGSEVYFINGLVPWTKDLDTKIVPENLNEQLSSYTKNILDFDHRDDYEILDFFRTLQNKFKLMPKQNWINLFESMLAQQTDLAPLNNHPGIRSHKQTADMVIDFLTNSQGTTNA